MKSISLVISGALIPVALAAIGYTCVVRTLPFDAWSEQNRHMLYESFSPQRKYKLGVYDYDEGALGYSAVQVSAVRAGAHYPISGNLLRDQYIDSVKWISADTAEFPLEARGDATARLEVRIK